MENEMRNEFENEVTPTLSEEEVVAPGAADAEEAGPSLPEGGEEGIAYRERDEAAADLSLPEGEAEHPKKNFFSSHVHLFPQW